MIRHLMIICLLTALVLSSCFCQKTNQLDKTMIDIDNKIGNQLGYLKSSLTQVTLLAESIFSNDYAVESDTSLYELYDKSIYKKVNNGKTAMFSTGYIAPNQEIFKRIYLTEGLENIFVNFINVNQQVTQIYYNDRLSFNRIYPWIDVLSQFPYNTNICEYPFYFMADDQYNPDRSVITIDNLYIDPAGRGWVFSIIAPIYNGDTLEGVLGIDLLISDLLDRIKELDKQSYFVMQENGTVIAASKAVKTLLEIPSKSSVKYLSPTQGDTSLSNEFKLSHSKNVSLRQLYEDIKLKKQINKIRINDSEFRLVYRTLKDINWTVVLLQGMK